MLSDSVVFFILANFEYFILAWLAVLLMICYVFIEDIVQKVEVWKEQPPSFYLSLGFPVASLFKDTWHEITAVIYLQALVLLGDSWPERPISPSQVRKVFAGHGFIADGIPGFKSIIDSDERIKRVAARLTCGRDAHVFSHLWAPTPRCECTHVCAIACAENMGEEHASCACMCHELVEVKK